MSEKPQIQILTAFPTLMARVQWQNTEQFNKDLHHEILKMRVREPDGINRSNQGGTWHSSLKLIQECGAPGKQLGEMFFAAFRALGSAHGVQENSEFKMALSAWAMMYRDRGYATPHTHPNCHFSGVYYVTNGDGNSEPKMMATGVPVHPGMLEFVDTRGGPNGLQASNIVLQPSMRVLPKPGLMIVFPAWLPHMVHPVVGSDERVSVACNATIQKITPPPPKSEQTENTPSDDTDERNQT